MTMKIKPKLRYYVSSPSFRSPIASGREWHGALRLVREKRGSAHFRLVTEKRGGAHFSRHRARSWDRRVFLFWNELPLNTSRDYSIFCQGRIYVLTNFGVQPPITTLRLTKNLQLYQNEAHKLLWPTKNQNTKEPNQEGIHPYIHPGCAKYG